MMLCSEDSKTSTRTCVQEGDAVVLYVGYNQVHYIAAVERERIFNSRAGNFYHSGIIGAPYGSKVYDRKTKRWCAILRPTPRLIMDSLQHRTQIIYQADANALLMMLDMTPGKVVLETGTGSGSFTVQLAAAVTPGGHVHSFELHRHRYEEAVKEFQQYALSDTITVHHRDVYKHGFQLSDPSVPDKFADAVFLDLPEPWKALPHAQRHLKPLGRLCTFSPCIEQIQQTAEWLRAHRFTDIRVFESLVKPWGIMTNENDCGSTSLAEQDSEEASSYAEPPRSFDEGAENPDVRSKKRRKSSTEKPCMGPLVHPAVSSAADARTYQDIYRLSSAPQRDVLTAPAYNVPRYAPQETLSSETTSSAVATHSRSMFLHTGSPSNTTTLRPEQSFIVQGNSAPIQANSVPRNSFSSLQPLDQQLSAPYHYSTGQHPSTPLSTAFPTRTTLTSLRCDATPSQPWATTSQEEKILAPLPYPATRSSSISTEDTLSAAPESSPARRRSTTLNPLRQDKLPVWERLYQEASVRAQKQQAARERITLETKILSGNSSRQWKPEQWNQKWKRMMERYKTVMEERQRLHSHLEFQHYLEEKKECIFRPRRYTGSPMTEEESNIFVSTLMELVEKQKHCKQALEECQGEETMLDAQIREKFFDMLKKHQDIPQVAQKNLLTEDPIELLRDESQKQYAALMERRLNLLHEATALHNAHYQWLHLHGVDKAQYDFDFDTTFVEELQKSSWFQMGIKCFPSLKANAAFSSALHSQLELHSEGKEPNGKTHVAKRASTEHSNYLDLGFPEYRKTGSHKLSPQLKKHHQRDDATPPLFQKSSVSYHSTLQPHPDVLSQKTESSPVTERVDPPNAAPAYSPSPQASFNPALRYVSHSFKQHGNSIAPPQHPSRLDPLRNSVFYTSQPTPYAAAPLPMKPNLPAESRIYTKAKHPVRRQSNSVPTQMKATGNEGFWMNILHKLLNGGRA